MSEKLLDNGDEYLPAQYIKYCDDLLEDSEATWDDFYDSVNITRDRRSNFLTASILKQAQEILKNENKPGQCPFCKSSKSRNVCGGPSMEWVECLSCSARGPVAMTKETAIKKWNESGS